MFGGSINVSPRSIEEGILGEPLVLRWKLTLNTPYENGLTFLVCLDRQANVCIASGSHKEFRPDSTTNFTDRIQTIYVKPYHVLTINKLKQTDNKLKIYATVAFKFGISLTNVITLPAIEISVVGESLAFLFFLFYH